MMRDHTILVAAIAEVFGVSPTIDTYLPEARTRANAAALALAAAEA